MYLPRVKADLLGASPGAVAILISYIQTCLIIVHLTSYLLISSHLKQVHPLSHVLVSWWQWGGRVNL